MNTLFDIGPVLPPGFFYQENFITAAEETHLVQVISGFELKPMQFHEYTAKRKVLSFGRGWSFTEQQLKSGNPIPGQFSFLVERIAKHLNIAPENIAQFLVTEYPVGSVINWHRDAPPFETVIGISLLSGCNLKLRPQEKEKQARSATITLPVKCRSMYIMTGVSKTGWQHCTMPLNTVRYALTFRTLNAPF